MWSSKRCFRMIITTAIQGLELTQPVSCAWVPPPHPQWSWGSHPLGTRTRPPSVTQNSHRHQHWVKGAHGKGSRGTDGLTEARALSPVTLFHPCVCCPLAAGSSNRDTINNYIFIRKWSTNDAGSNYEPCELETRKIYVCFICLNATAMHGEHQFNKRAPHYVLVWMNQNIANKHIGISIPLRKFKSFSFHCF